MKVQVEMKNILPRQCGFKLLRKFKLQKDSVSHDQRGYITYIYNNCYAVVKIFKTDSFTTPFFNLAIQVNMLRSSQAMLRPRSIRKKLKKKV